MAKGSSRQEGQDREMINKCNCTAPQKIYATSGCHLCWHCGICEKFGSCDNTYWELAREMGPYSRFTVLGKNEVPHAELLDWIDKAAQLEAENDSLRQLHTAQMEENERLKTYAMLMEGRVSNSSWVIKTRTRLGLSDTMMNWIIPDEHRDALKEGE